MLVKVRQFLTRVDENPVPMRTMRVRETLQETGKAVRVILEGVARPSGECLHCGREITHPVSLMYGIGPVCGQHFHIDTTGKAEENYKRIQETMSKLTWEGWLPKSAATFMPEDGYKIVFVHNGQTYRVTTYDMDKVKEISDKADKIISKERVG